MENEFENDGFYGEMYGFLSCLLLCVQQYHKTTTDDLVKC